MWPLLKFVLGSSGAFFNQWSKWLKIDFTALRVVPKTKSPKSASRTFWKQKLYTPDTYLYINYTSEMMMVMP